MADGDRKARDAYRISVQADLADMARQIHDVQRDHRGIRQTLGDLAAMVNRSTADVSATLAQIDELRTIVLEVRDESRGAMGAVQRDTRRSLDQLEAHARLDRDWIGATQANVQLIADDLARQHLEAAELRQTVARAEADLVRQQASELEHVATLRDQLAEARAAIENLGEAVKRQTGQITKLRADLKKASSLAPKAAAKKPAAKPEGRPRR
jgi:chromosome segregation ATPase